MSGGISPDSMVILLATEDVLAQDCREVERIAILAKLVINVFMGYYF